MVFDGAGKERDCCNRKINLSNIQKFGQVLCDLLRTFNYRINNHNSNGVCYGMASLKGLSVVIPVFNEDDDILGGTCEVLQELGAEVIVVDDGSKTPSKFATITHNKNCGYGSALMTGISAASNDLIITADGDGQHSASEVMRISEAWKLMPKVDLLIGTRRIKKEIWYRYLARKAINLVASLVANFWMPDLNGGLRMFRKSLVMNYFPILCKQFSFTTSLTMSMMLDNYTVEWFPIKVAQRPKGKSKVNLLKHGLITLFYILWIGAGLRTRGIRAAWRRLWK